LNQKFLQEKGAEIEKLCWKRFDDDSLSYLIVGFPDALFPDKVIEIKYAGSDLSVPHEHHILQLRAYLWLTNLKEGELWYFTPNRMTSVRVPNLMGKLFTPSF